MCDAEADDCCTLLESFSFECNNKILAKRAVKVYSFDSVVEITLDYIMYVYY